jgi:hypothetical protein
MHPHGEQNTHAKTDSGEEKKKTGNALEQYTNTPNKCAQHIHHYAVI